MNKLKRVVSFLMMLVIIISAVPLNYVYADEKSPNHIWDGTYDIDWQGDGSVDTPYLITSPEELAGLSYMVANKKTYSGSYFSLTTDIYLNVINNYADWTDYTPENNWVPIGGHNYNTLEYSATYKFCGNFEGNHHIIYGLYYNNSLSKYGTCIGLFGYTNYGNISNLELSHSYINGYTYVGGIIGKVDSTNISNCIIYSDNVIKGESGSIGGVAGQISKSIVSNCMNYGNISGNGSAGGIMAGANKTNIYNCYNYGVIKGKGYLGGICGSYGNPEYNSTYYINECYNGGIINGSSDYIGGIMGYILGDDGDIQINRCYNEGVISGNNYIGGIAGVQRVSFGGIYLTDCYNIADISGNNNIGGITGGMQRSYDTAKILRAYNTGSVNGNENVGSITGGYELFSYGYGYIRIMNCVALENEKIAGYSAKPNFTISSQSVSGGEYASGNVLLSAANMSQKNNYPNWNFSSVWNISDKNNGGLPYLRWAEVIFAGSHYADIKDRDLDVDIKGIRTVLYDQNSGTYNVDSLDVVLTAKKLYTKFDYSWKTYPGYEHINVELKVPKGFSFDKDKEVLIKKYTTKLKEPVETTIYLNNPSLGTYELAAALSGDQKPINLISKDILVTSKNFQEDIYRADFNVNQGVGVANLEQYVLEENTPARQLKKAAEDEHMEGASVTWSTLNNTINALDDPGNLADYTFKEKDFYMAMIFEMLDCNLENKYNDYISAEGVKDLKSIKSTIMGDLKDRYTYKELTEGFFQNSDDKANVMKLIKNRFIADHPMLDNIDAISGFVFDGIEYTGNLFDIVDRVYANYQLYTVNSSIKQMLVDMYNEAPSDNIALKSALWETKTLIESSEDEMAQMIAAGAVQMAGKDTVQFVVKEAWKTTKDAAYVACPELLIAHIYVKSMQFVSEGVFNTSAVTEAYYKLDAVTKIRTVVKKAYYKSKNRFIDDRSVTNAQNYNAAVNVLGAYYSVDCNMATGFVDAVQNAAFAKIFGVKDADELKESIEGLRSSINLFVSSANTEWINWLEIDYPELYDYYETNMNNYKVYAIRCPVDVYVFDSEGVRVASSIGGEVYWDEKSNVIIGTVGDEKTVYTYGDEYTVIYNGTDSGTMNIQIDEYTGGQNTATVNFNDIPLETDLVYIAEENGCYSGEGIYSLTSDENVIQPDFNSTEDAEQHTLSVDLGLILSNAAQEGDYAKGEKVDITTYVPEECSFLGWESDAGDIFEDSSAITTTVKMPDEDVNITANIEIPDYIAGDVDRNEILTDADAGLLMKYLNDTADFKFMQKKAANANEDDSIDMRDVISILSNPDKAHINFGTDRIIVKPGDEVTLDIDATGDYYIEQIGAPVGFFSNVIDTWQSNSDKRLTGDKQTFSIGSWCDAENGYTFALTAHLAGAPSVNDTVLVVISDDENIEIPTDGYIQFGQNEITVSPGETAALDIDASGEYYIVAKNAGWWLQSDTINGINDFYGEAVLQFYTYNKLSESTQSFSIGSYVPDDAERTFTITAYLASDPTKSDTVTVHIQ